MVFVHCMCGVFVCVVLWYMCKVWCCLVLVYGVCLVCVVYILTVCGICIVLCLVYVYCIHVCGNFV